MRVSPGRRTIELYHRQRSFALNVEWLRRFATTALTECEREGIAPGSALTLIGEVEVSIVSDRTIAQVHRRFMGVPGPTDVITFEHGEILISAATAARYANDHGKPVEHEIGLYIIHGILHLSGHDDRTELAASEMTAAQEAILSRVLGSTGSLLSH